MCRGGGSLCCFYLIFLKGTKSATMNIFRKKLFYFLSFVKAELS